MRIQIVGTSGAGKTTLAKELSGLTGYPHIEIDNLQFGENWCKRPDVDFDKDLEKALSPTNWIACGNYFSSQVKIYDKADRIIWLNYSFSKIFWQVTLRTFRRLWTKAPCCNNNIETFSRQFFSKHSIFLWVLTSHRRRIRNYNRLIKDQKYRHKWIVVRTHQDRSNCINQILSEL